jgi:hypothetical protein
MDGILILEPGRPLILEALDKMTFGDFHISGRVAGPAIRNAKIGGRVVLEMGGTCSPQLLLLRAGLASKGQGLS